MPTVSEWVRRIEDRVERTIGDARDVSPAERLRSVRDAFRGELNQVPSDRRSEVVQEVVCARLKAREDWLLELFLALSANGVCASEPHEVMSPPAPRSDGYATRDRELRELRATTKERDEQLFDLRNQLETARNDLEQATRERVAAVARAQALVLEVADLRQHAVNLETTERSLQSKVSSLDERLRQKDVELIAATTELRKLQAAQASSRPTADGGVQPAPAPSEPAAPVVSVTTSAAAPRAGEAARVFFQKIAAAHQLGPADESSMLDTDVRLGWLAAELVEFFVQFERSVFAQLESIATPRPELAKLETELRAFARTDRMWWWCLTAPQPNARNHPIGVFKMYTRKIQDMNSILLSTFFGVLRNDLVKTVKRLLNPDVMIGNSPRNPWEYYCDTAAHKVPLEVADECMKIFSRNLVDRWGNA